MFRTTGAIQPWCAFIEKSTLLNVCGMWVVAMENREKRIDFNISTGLKSQFEHSIYLCLSNNSSMITDYRFPSIQTKRRLANFGAALHECSTLYTHAVRTYSSRTSTRDWAYHAWWFCKNSPSKPFRKGRFSIIAINIDVNMSCSLPHLLLVVQCDEYQSELAVIKYPHFHHIIWMSSIVQHAMYWMAYLQLSFHIFAAQAS